MSRRVSRRHFMGLSAAAVSLGSIGGASALFTDQELPTERPLIFGHRGAAGLAPANTIRAIRTGLEYDVDGIELDVRQTSDGELVLFHDPILNWSTDGHGRVHRVTADRIDAVSFEGEPIPTLAEGLEVLADADVEIILEIKRSGYTDATLDLVEDFGLLDRLAVSAFHPEIIEPAIERDVPAGLIGSVPTRDLIEEATSVGATNVSVHYVPRANPWFVEEAHEAGLAAGIWNLVETERSIQDAVEPGPSFVTTNRPDVATALFSSN